MPWYLSQTGQRCVTWNIEPESDENISRSAQKMADYVNENLHYGDIILLHPMHDTTGKVLETIRLIVDNAKGRGFVFKTLS